MKFESPETDNVLDLIEGRQPILVFPKPIFHYVLCLSFFLGSCSNPKALRFNLIV